jgi:hypothetical protein
MNYFIFIDKLLARLNKGNQKFTPVNNQSPKRQLTNRKTINIPCTSLTSTMVDLAKDEELMPPPSSALNQEFVIQCDNSDSIVNNSRKYFRRHDHLPKCCFHYFPHYNNIVQIFKYFCIIDMC